MKIPGRSPSVLLLIVWLGLYGCAANRGSEVARGHDNMDAVLWMQTSAEYAASTNGIFAAAAASLKQIAGADPDSVERMAVVMDIDETVLDNSPYQGQTVLDDTTYQSETWDQWVALGAAAAVPGSIDFIKASQSIGVRVFFITNRACRARPGSTESCPQKHDTLANLQKLGVGTDAGSLLLRGDIAPERCRAYLSESERLDGRWSSNKTSRRHCVGVDYDIVMLFGDQLGDFTAEPANSTTGSRREIASEFLQYWGKSWFMLPNPAYGDWQPRDAESKRAAVRGID